MHTTNSSKIDFVISIFYEELYWQSLFKNFLSSFILIEIQNKRIESYSFYFGSLQGSHISLAVKAFKNPGTLENEYIKKIGSYLKNHPSQTKPKSFSIDYFFMNYPNNSVLLNIDQLPISYSFEYKSSVARQQISFVMLSYFSSVEVTTETKYLLMFHLQLGLIKAYSDDLYNGKKLFLMNYDYFQTLGEFERDRNVTYSGDAKYFVNNIFSSFKERLVNIATDMWNSEISKNDSSWLHNWVLFCKDVRKNMIFNHAFIFLRKLTYEHMGIHEEQFPHISTNFVKLTFDEIK